MGRRKADRFLRLIAEKLASEENLAQVFSIRPSSEAAEVREVRRQAVALFGRYLPLFLARLPMK
jgi:hypothetical protein